MQSACAKYRVSFKCHRAPASLISERAVIGRLECLRLCYDITKPRAIARKMAHRTKNSVVFSLKCLLLSVADDIPLITPNITYLYKGKC